MPPSIHHIWNELDARMDINFGPVLLRGLVGVDQKIWHLTVHNRTASKCS